MGGGWTHLSLSERVELEKGIERGLNHSELARLIGRSRATVIREKRRYLADHDDAADAGGVVREYVAVRAQQLARQRTGKSHQPWKFNNERLAGWVETQLRAGYSPARIAQRSRLVFPNEPGMWVSHESVYGWVYRDRPQLRKYLPRYRR